MPNVRAPQNVKAVPFLVSKPLKLRHHIQKGSTKVELHGICLFEMSQYFLCLKKHGFSQEPCSNEYNEFQACYTAAVEKSKLPKEDFKNKMSSQKINSLLNTYSKANQI